MITFLGIIIPLLLIGVSCLVIWKSSNSFELAADYLGRNMSEGIKGASINAIASSMPEFLATIFFLFYVKDIDGFSGGIGITSGSAVYNLLVIPAGVIIIAIKLSSGKGFRINKAVILRDGIFLLISTLILIFVLHLEELNVLTGVILVFTYVVYLLFLIYRTKINVKKETKTVSVQYNKSTPDYKDYLHLNIEKLVLRNSEIKRFTAWVLLIISTIILSLGTWMLVQGTEWLGAESYSLPVFGELQGLNIPILFVALILAAAASSVPDTIISFKDAKKGNYEDAFSNVFGSNIFNISFALGMPLLIFTAIYGPLNMTPEIIEFSLGLWEILLYLTVIMIIIFSVGNKMTKLKAYLMILFYFLYIMIAIGLALNIDFLVNFYNIITSLV